MANLFVVGATGVVGRIMVPLLLREGHHVTGMTRRPEGADRLRSTGAEALVADALDRHAVVDAVRASAPDAIIHQLTDLGGRDFAANNRLRIEGTANLVEAAREVGLRRMVAQSLALAYAPGPGLATEDTPLDTDAVLPRRATVEGVQALEEAVASLPEGVILRYGTLYGPGTWFARSGWVAEQVRRGEVAATADVTSFLHAFDAAQAAVDALKWPPGIVNIADDDPAPGTTWLPVYAGLLGAPEPPQGDAAREPSRGVSNAKARRELKWEPHYPTWRDGFSRAFAEENTPVS